MAITVRRRWLSLAGSLIALLSSFLTSYIQSQSNINPVSDFVEVVR